MSKILIVEDEESIAELEKDYLELSGFEVEIENRGDTGLERALKEEFDLFILDLMLPGTDGFEICKRIRQVKNTPILMVSAKKDDIDKIRGLGLGCLLYTSGREEEERTRAERRGGRERRTGTECGRGGERSPRAARGKMCIRDRRRTERSLWPDWWQGRHSACRLQWRSFSSSRYSCRPAFQHRSQADSPARCEEELQQR